MCKNENLYSSLKCCCRKHGKRDENFVRFTADQEARGEREKEDRSAVPRSLTTTTTANDSRGNSSPRQLDASIGWTADASGRRRRSTACDVSFTKKKRKIWCHVILMKREQESDRSRGAGGEGGRESRKERRSMREARRCSCSSSTGVTGARVSVRRSLMSPPRLWVAIERMI